VFYTREVQGVQKWLTKIRSIYCMSLYFAQVNMSCALGTFMPTDVRVAMRWETKVTAIDRVLGQNSGLLQIMHQQHVFAYSKVVMTVYSLC
jgi:hypothetical protein